MHRKRLDLYCLGSIIDLNLIRDSCFDVASDQAFQIIIVIVSHSVDRLHNNNPRKVNITKASYSKYIT